jgi:1,2-diacylglycerol 3-alpha-glucosyltransferase
LETLTRSQHQTRSNQNNSTPLWPRFGHLARTLFGVSIDAIDSCILEKSETNCRIGEVLRSRGLLDRTQTRAILQAQARWKVAVAGAATSGIELPLETTLSLCMPAYNEATNIEDVLDGACAILPEFVEDFEIIVVNDGSRDKTGEILARYMTDEPRLRVVTHPENRGYGAALTSAMRAASGDLVCIIDSDSQFNLLNLPALLSRLRDSDMVIGYRRKRADSRSRLLNAWAWNWLMRVLLGVSVRDLDCAFKLYRRETVQELSLTSRGACISAEILVQCVRKRLTIAQVPVEHYPRSHGQPTGAALKVIARAFKELPHLMRYRWARSDRAPAGSPSAFQSHREPEGLDGRAQSSESLGRLSRNGNGRYRKVEPLEDLVPNGMSTSDAAKEELPELTMTVCMLAACPFPANHGTPGSIREIAEALAERGHEVHVVTYPFGQEIPVQGVKLHRISADVTNPAIVVGPTRKKPLYDLKMIFKTLEVIRRYQPAVLHAHGYEAALAACACRALTGVPVVYSAHNTMADELPTYNFIRPQWLARLVANALDRVVPRLADRIVPHSDNLLEFLRQRDLLERSEPVIRFGINMENVAQGDGALVRARYGLGMDPVVLYTGVMNPFQRLDLLLKAMAIVIRTEPSAKLFVVRTLPGEEFLADFHRQAEALGLRGHLVVTQHQPLRAVQELHSACDVAVAPRTQEPGFPIKILNAMAAGKACVMYASSARGLRHKEDAYLVAPDTAEALAEGLLELIADSRLRERLARQGREYVLKNHDRRKIAAQLSDVFLRTVLSGEELQSVGLVRVPPPESHSPAPYLIALETGNDNAVQTKVVPKTALQSAVQEVDQ